MLDQDAVAGRCWRRRHGFRKHPRIEEHLLTSMFFLDKAWDKGIPVWIVSLDLSKAFARANRSAFWLALRDRDIFDYPVLILQSIYSNQLGKVEVEHSISRPFPIHAGVRQGCVLSPRLFCSVLQWGIGAGRRNAETGYASLMISFLCTNSCGNNGSIGRSGTQIAEHGVAVKRNETSCCNFRGSAAIFLCEQSI